MRSALAKQILFVGGKGGVGKSTIASAVALHHAGQGHRTLLVSTDPAHSLADIFGNSIGDGEHEIAANLYCTEIDSDQQLHGYIESVAGNLRSLVSPEMYHEVDRQMQLARSAPGAAEAAMLERVAVIMSEATERYSRIVFDTAPTGQTLRLLSLPDIMAAWSDGLLRQRQRADEAASAFARIDSLGRSRSGGHRPHQAAPGHPSEATRPGDELSLLQQNDPGREVPDRFARIREILMRRRQLFLSARRLLTDQAATGFLLVVNPEKLPVIEGRTAMQTLRRFGINVSGVVVNRILPEQPLGDFMEQRRDRERTYLRMIDSDFSGLSRASVTLRAQDVEGIAQLRLIATELAL